MTSITGNLPKSALGDRRIGYIVALLCRSLKLDGVHRYDINIAIPVSSTWLAYHFGDLVSIRIQQQRGAFVPPNRKLFLLTGKLITVTRRRYLPIAGWISRSNSSTECLTR